MTCTECHNAPVGHGAQAITAKNFTFVVSQSSRTFLCDDCVEIRYVRILEENSDLVEIELFGRRTDVNWKRFVELEKNAGVKYEEACELLIALEHLREARPGFLVIHGAGNWAPKHVHDLKLYLRNLSDAAAYSAHRFGTEHDDWCIEQHGPVRYPSEIREKWAHLFVQATST